MKICEVFERVSTHQIEGIMLHDQLADAFAFLALPGFENLHERQYIEESRNMRKIHQYYIGHMNALIREGRPEDPQVLPRNWNGYSRNQLSIDTKRKAVRDAMEKWVEWETKTKTLYQECATHLDAAGEIAAACVVKEILRDVDEELCFANELHLRLEAVTYDMPTMDQMQAELMSG